MTIDNALSCPLYHISSYLSLSLEIETCGIVSLYYQVVVGVANHSKRRVVHILCFERLLSLFAIEIRKFKQTNFLEDNKEDSFQSLGVH